MTSVIRILCSVALMASLAGGLLDCQPCEDPSQLFCERSASTSTSRGV